MPLSNRSFRRGETIQLRAMSALDLSVDPQSAILDTASSGYLPYMYEPSANSFISVEPFHVKGQSWAVAPEGVRTGPSNIYEPDRAASSKTHYSQPGGTLHTSPENPESLVGHPVSPSLSGHRPAEYPCHLMVPDYAEWNMQPSPEQYSNVDPSLSGFPDGAFPHLAPSMMFMQGPPPPSASYPSYGLSAHPEPSFGTEASGYVQPIAPFSPFDFSLLQDQNASRGDSAFPRGQAGYQEGYPALRGTAKQEHQRNYLGSSAAYPNDLAPVNARDMVGSASSLSNKRAHLGE